MISLPDVNVLLSLAWKNHAHHQAAHDWFAREASAGWATCLLSEVGFIRLSMNSPIVGVSIDSQAALGLLSGMTAHPSHRFVEVAPTVTATPFDALLLNLKGYRQVTDATLLHLARFHGMKLVTFDAGISSLCPWSANLQVLVP